MDEVLALSVLVALFSATLGSLAVRWLLRASYNVLTIVWLMAAFGGVVLSFAFQRLELSLLASIVVVTLMPVAAFYGCGSSVAEPQSPVLWALIYGGLLLAISTALSFNAQSFQEVLVPLWGAERSLVGILAASLLMATNGLVILIKFGRKIVR
ncbi:hypothetical protein [Pseudomonas sp. RIT-PI-AD]|uniref:hypothetical protein n=1 Tax=Pseudomonas sp. RIT-PI-AD TaxID=3035294 RepID=UPI0021DA11DD|nr:hypothetical protein [Pseudomonas sp. RIT-PI-AD]